MNSSKAVKIVLHGPLKDMYPDDITINAASPLEAVNGFAKQTGIFVTKPGEEKFIVSILDFDTVEKLNSPIPSNTNELHITPTMFGGKGGFFKVIVGIVIIAAVTLMTAGTLSWAAVGAVASGGGFAGAAFNFGVSLVLGGLLEMLSPAPKMDLTGNSVSDPEASKYLGASQNTAKIGTRISLLYGKHIAYGQYLSFDVDSKDVAL